MHDSEDGLRYAALCGKDVVGIHNVWCMIVVVNLNSFRGVPPENLKARQRCNLGKRLPKHNSKRAWSPDLADLALAGVESASGTCRHRHQMLSVFEKQATSGKSAIPSTSSIWHVTSDVGYCSLPA